MLIHQIGSFGAQRVTAAPGGLHAPTGLFVQGTGFHDARNDYPLDAQAWDETATCGRRASCGSTAPAAPRQ